MIIKEYRVTLPMTVEEYQVGGVNETTRSQSFSSWMDLVTIYLYA